MRFYNVITHEATHIRHAPPEIAISHLHIGGTIYCAKIRTMVTSSKTKKKSSQKAVVELLCLKVRADKITAERDGTVKQVKMLVF